MILYFSATGNSKYIAETIAKSMNDECMSIVTCINEKRYCFENEKVLGVVSPTYFWRLPRIVAAFLENIQMKNCAYTFFVLSYGTTTGSAVHFTEKLMQENNQKFDAYYSVIMPDTWTPMFDLTDQKKVDAKLNEGEQQLQDIIQKIQSNSNGDFAKGKLPVLITALPSLYMYHTERKTKYLSVNKDICIGCGFCAKKCPVQAIAMKDGYPVWKEKECEMCLGCLHRCPKFAIQYGNGKTNKHGQYRNPNTTI